MIIYFLQKPPINFRDFLWDVKDSKTGLELIIQKVANVPQENGGLGISNTREGFWPNGGVLGI